MCSLEPFATALVLQRPAPRGVTLSPELPARPKPGACLLRCLLCSAISPSLTGVLNPAVLNLILLNLTLLNFLSFDFSLFLTFSMT